MIRVEFEFETVDEVRQVINYGKYASALDEIYNMCRSQLKHGEPLGEKADEILEEIKSIAAEYME